MLSDLRSIQHTPVRFYFISKFEIYKHYSVLLKISSKYRFFKHLLNLILFKIDHIVRNHILKRLLGMILKVVVLKSVKLMFINNFGVIYTCKYVEICIQCIMTNKRWCCGVIIETLRS